LRSYHTQAAQMSTVQYTFKHPFSGGGGKAQLFNLHVIPTDTQSACLLTTQPGVLSQKLSSAILENSKSRSTQKNSSPCHDYLCIVISVFLLSSLICLLFIFLHLLFSVKRFSYIFPTQSRSNTLYTSIHSF